MPLHFQMDSMEGVPADIAGLYTKQEDSGKFVLTGIQNIVHKSKLDSFRDNNVKLMNQLDAFKGVDLDKIKATETALEEAKIQLENSGKVDEETVNKLVESRVSAIQSDAKETQGKLEGEVTTLSRQLESLLLDGSVDKAAIDHKVTKSALTDVKLRAKTVFKLENGKPVAYDSNGQKMYGDDGVSELSINSWVKGLVKTSPHLFEPSVTGGLTDNNGGGDFKGDPSSLTPKQKIAMALNNV